MNQRTRILLFLALMATHIGGLSAYAEGTPIFDGKTLAGWDFNPKMWRVEDGAVTGGTGKSNNPLSPHLRSLQRRPQAPHAKSKFLAI